MVEHLEQRAFNAGFNRGFYAGVGARHEPFYLRTPERYETTCLDDWEEYSSQPFQFELPLEGGVEGYNVDMPSHPRYRGAPDEQNAKV
jgi:hypothetical protein